MPKPTKQFYIKLLIFFSIIFIISVFWSIKINTPAQTLEVNLAKNENLAKTALSAKKQNQNTTKIVENKSETQSASIITGNVTTQISFAPNTIFYDALVEARNAGILDFSGKNYSVLGFFVTDIGTLHSGDGKDLLYYINGKEATVGVSVYILKDSDVIEWKLE